MIELTKTEEQIYDRLYFNRPTTTRGRINRAIMLTHKGWCNSRAYDDCFEMGDGDQVLEGFLDHIQSREPFLREKLIDLGFWAPWYDDLMNRQGDLF